MASGCPVINTNIPASGVSWVSQHDVSGLTVPVGDATALAAAGRALANDSELRNRLSMGARARARAEFDHRQMAQRWAKAVGA
jgi:rhamnosyl/mannosyltransferase